MYAQQYNPTDVEVINTLIKNNCLSAKPNAPESWEFAIWNDSNPKKITKLNLNNRLLCGEASFVGLTQLKKLKCNKNNLTKLDVSNCTQLKDLQCYRNSLAKLDVSGCVQLYSLECSKNNLTELDVSGCPQLQYLIYDYKVIINTKKEALYLHEREKKVVLEKNTSFSYYVEQEMNKWLQKGEFEKTEEWQLRTNRDSLKTAELLKIIEQAYIAERSKNIPSGVVTLGAYNADEEFFLIRNSIHGNYRLHVPIDKAPNFKNNWDSHIIPQYEIINDHLMFTGYKYTPMAFNNNSVEQKENQIITNQPYATMQIEQVGKQVIFQDIMYTHKGGEIKCKIIEMGEKTIRYQYEGEDLINTISKNLVSQIKFVSGRVEKVTDKIIVRGEQDWQKVVITNLESDIQGLTRVGESMAKANSGWNTTNQGKMEKAAMDKLKKEAAAKGCHVILILSTTGKAGTYEYGNVWSGGTKASVTGVFYKY